MWEQLIFPMMMKNMQIQPGRESLDRLWESSPVSYTHLECLNARATEFRVNMGKASFLSREIPVTGEVREVIDEPFTFNKKEYKATCLTVGNPHCIIFMDQVSQEKVRELGPYVENADEFPERVNLQICRQIDKGLSLIHI